MADVLGPNKSICLVFWVLKQLRKPYKAQTDGDQSLSFSIDKVIEECFTFVKRVGNPYFICEWDIVGRPLSRPWPWPGPWHWFSRSRTESIEIPISGPPTQFPSTSLVRYIPHLPGWEKGRQTRRINKILKWNIVIANPWRHKPTRFIPLVFLLLPEDSEEMLQFNSLSQVGR